MSCSKEEIEKKRLAALQKRLNVLSASTQNNVQKSFSLANSPKSILLNPSDCGTLKKISNHKSFHPYARSDVSNINIMNSIPVTKVVSGTIYLISENRFEVNPSEFCTPLINIFKTIHSRNYDSNSKLWNFSIDDYEELISKVSPLAPHIVLGVIPSYVLKILREPVVDAQSVDLSPIESTLRNKLLPFQEDGVRFGVARRGRCMIADDMGLGKTYQALAIASYYRHNWPLLIVTTSSMRETWQSKIHELLPSVPMMNIVTLTTGKDTELVADRQTEVVIVSFKITTMYADLLKAKKFGAVIIDESHNLKSHKARCTSTLGGVARGAARVILLSGTPALSRPAELYTQLALIEPTMFGSYTEYGKRYCAAKQTNFGWDMTGQSNLAELQVILNRRFLIRRTKEQVLTTLEAKTRESVLLDESLLQLTPERRQGLSAAEACARGAPDRHSALITYFSESAAYKIPAVCKYIEQTLRETDEKFLVFAHHRNVIDAVCGALDGAGVRYVCVVGATPAHARAELVERFQQCEDCRCAVLSVTAAGAGLTLTAAGLVLFAELHWNPGVLTQAEARAHRLGREGGVRVRYLLARGTADDLLWPMLQGKLDVLNSVGLSEDSFQNTTMKHQESRNNITQYMSPAPKNKNDYIPGTNIRKVQPLCSSSAPTTQQSFMEHDEDDELLANLDL